MWEDVVELFSYGPAVGVQHLIIGTDYIYSLQTWGQWLPFTPSGFGGFLHVY